MTLQGTWAFLSIGVLSGDNGFQHRFHDDMESFYYIILYASVLWLPHNNSLKIEEELAEFFDSYRERNGKVQGGTPKESNRSGGKFASLWGFKSEALWNWLEKVRRMQWISEEDQQPRWTPKALYDQWKCTDALDLPIDDRIDNIKASASKGGKKKQPGSPSVATRVSVHPSRQIVSSRKHKSGSSKRPINKTEFEDNLDESKRQRRTSLRLASKGQERETDAKESLDEAKQQRRSSARLASKK